MHRLLRALAAAAAAVLSATPLLATDMPFAADSLRLLARDAEAIVSGDSASALPRPAPAKAAGQSLIKLSLYSFRVAGILKGKDKLSIGEKIRVALPVGIDVSSPGQLERSLLFLRALTSAEMVRYGVDEAAYLVVSGHYGVVDATSPVRTAEIADYVNEIAAPFFSTMTAARTDRLLRWTSKHLDSTDLFLQRSAAIDLYFERANPKAVEQLGFLLNAKNSFLSSKQTALLGLEASDPRIASPILKAFAENVQMQPALRENAIKAFKFMPDGESQLLEWKNSTDSTLSTTANKVMIDR